MNYLDKLIKIDMVGGDSVGFAGEPSDFFVIYTKIKNDESEDEFAILLEHKNPIVRAMGVALLSPNKGYHNILNKLQSDKTEINIMPTGCRLFSITLGEFVAKSLINPDYFRTGSQETEPG